MTPRTETADPRDMRPDPPAILDPYAVLFNRECVRKMLATGDVTFPRGADWVGAK